MEKLTVADLHKAINCLPDDVQTVAQSPYLGADCVAVTTISIR